jgi:hypothetical protein
VTGSGPADAGDPGAGEIGAAFVGSTVSGFAGAISAGSSDGGGTRAGEVGAAEAPWGSAAADPTRVENGSGSAAVPPVVAWPTPDHSGGIEVAAESV